jgi:hypothetical protein
MLPLYFLTNLKMKKWISLCLGMLICSSNLFAAGPIVHAFLTERFFECFPKYDTFEKRAFMLGTLFPDIQYLGETPREHTHGPCPTLEEILHESSPFKAGVKFHVYVDHIREDFVADYKMYEKLGDMRPEQQQIIFLKLKLMEDEVVFPASHWQEWCDALLEINPEELNWGMDLSTIRKWHNLLTICFTNPPSTIMFLLSMSNASHFKIPQEEIANWSIVLKPTAESPTMQNFVDDLLDHFERRLWERAHARPS